MMAVGRRPGGQGQLTLEYDVPSRAIPRKLRGNSSHNFKMS